MEGNSCQGDFVYLIFDNLGLVSSQMYHHVIFYEHKKLRNYMVSGMASGLLLSATQLLFLPKIICVQREQGTGQSRLVWNQRVECYVYLLYSGRYPFQMQQICHDFCKSMYGNCRAREVADDPLLTYLTLFKARVGQFVPRHQTCVCSFNRSRARHTKIGDFVSFPI